MSKPGLAFLVVDDDEGARQIVVEYLKSYGYAKIVEAATGADALDVLQTQKIDFVISDWEMPTTSGLELLRALKTDERYKQIPFIMVTSPVSSERNKIEDAAALNVDGYIIKPFRSEVLREKIERALSEFKFDEKRGALVVDDDDSVRATVEEYLEQQGYQPIYAAKDGEEGFSLLRQHHEEIAFVVSDWEMPRMAGIDLLKRIRRDKKLGNTPFIMVTSQTSIERIKVKRALEADVDNYLLKPFRGIELKAKVDQVLARAKDQIGVDRDLNRGNEFLASSRWTEAIKVFNEVVAAHPDNIPAYLGLANAQRHLAPEKAIPKATQYLRKAIAINPKAEQPHIDLALTFESAMSLDKAIACLREALATCAFSEQIHFHLGRLLLRRGLAPEGVVELKRALEINPHYQEAIDLLGGREDVG